jgi:hypothetical protein
MDLDDRITEDPEDRAELRRREMRVEHRREPLIGTSEPLLNDREHMLDVEESIAQNRTVSRFLIMLGVFLLIFAGFWWVYTGWDVRGGRDFTIALMLTSAAIGLILIVAGAIKRSRQPALHREMRQSREDRAA